MARTHRNTIMACVAHNDPGRYRARTVQTEKEKRNKNRARRKREARREMRDW